MSPRHEREQPTQPRPDRARGFDFSDRERLFARISHQRLLEILQQRNTILYSAHVSQNDYGEFLFVTAQRPTETEPQVVTFFGLGLHEYRDRYLVDEWWWYESRPNPRREEREPASRKHILQMIDARHKEIEALAQAHPQSRAGEVFDLIADESDDDSVLADYRDELLDDLFDE